MRGRRLKMKNKKTLEMVQMAVLIAIILIMAITPLGYLRTGGLEISLMTVPVVIGAMSVGPGCGAVLGLAFGLTSFYQCFGMSAFGAALLNINPFLTFLVCVPTRALMGYLSGVLFRAMYKVDKTKTVSYFAAALLGAFMYTLFFMGMLMICFGNSDYLQDMNASLGNLNVFAFILALAGINGLLEMPLTCIAGGAVSKALSRAFRKA